MKGKYFFTSESVTEGHPDKMCDQISDAILDAIFKDDPNARVAVECLTKTGFVVVAGEVTTTTYVDVQKIVRDTIIEIGYDKPANIEQIRSTLQGSGFDEAMVQNFGSAEDVLIRIAPKEGLNSATLSNQVMDSLRDRKSVV